MAVIGTFGSFTAARMGIYASQASLNVTGHNIANINTKGYTRQRMDLSSLYSGGADRYVNQFNLNVGYGVMTDGVSQLRDPYLDIRFRNEQASLGYQETRMSGLSDLSSVFDEVGKGNYDFGIIENQLNDLYAQFQNLSSKVGSEEYDTLVRSSASTLMRLFNTGAEELDTLYDQTVDKLKSDIKEVNTILSRIQDLNVQIRNAGLCGDKALELRDTRNVLIDELSGFMKVDVTYTNEKIDQYTEVEKIVINLADTSPGINLVDGIYVTQLSMLEEVPQPNPAYDPTLSSSKAYLDWNGLPTDNEREAAPVLNTNNKIYLDKNGQETDDVTKAAPRPNPTNNYKYITAAGKPTDDPAEAAKALNPTYGFKYLKADGTGTNKAAEADAAGGAPKENPDKDKRWLDATGAATDDQTLAGPRANPNMGKLPYMGKDGRPTADETKAAPLMNENGQSSLTHPYLDENGQPTDDIKKAALQANPNYDPTLPTSMKYIGADGVTPTDDETAAAMVSNAKDGDKDVNMYRIRLEALTDPKGRYRRDEHDRWIDETVDLDDVTLHGSIQAHRELLTEEGEFASNIDLQFDPKANTKRGIPYYEKCLDFLAKSFAEAMNEANQLPAATIYQSGTDPNNVADTQTYFLDKDGNLLLDADGNPVPTTTTLDNKTLKDLGATLKSEYSYYDGGILFSNNGASDDTTGITAKNISVSKSWGETSVRVLNSVKPVLVKPEDGKDGNSTANDNIDHFINLLTEKITYNTTQVQADAAGGKFFVGTFAEMWRNTATMLADDRSTTTTLYNNYDLEVLNLDNQRSSVSGVDLNEEATNMMQFQKSYAAACRLLTTIDSMLDKLINGTAV